MQIWALALMQIWLELEEPLELFAKVRNSTARTCCVSPEYCQCAGSWLQDIHPAVLRPATFACFAMLQENYRRKLNGLVQLSFPAFVVKSLAGSNSKKKASQRRLTETQEKVLKSCNEVHQLQQEVRVLWWTRPMEPWPPLVLR